MSTNPFFNQGGPVVLAGVVAGDANAITEANRRIYTCNSKSSHMQAARVILETSGLTQTTSTTAPVVTLAPATTAPKSRKGTGVGGQEHTDLRAKARTWKIEQYHKGIKVSNRDACLHHGTLPAAELREVGMTGLAKALKAYNAVKKAA